MLRRFISARSSCTVPSLALFCERRWLARWSLFGLCDRRDRQMRAGRASRTAVEHPQLFRVGSGPGALVDVSGTPPPRSQRARLSPVCHSCRQTEERQLRQPPSLTEKCERGNRGEGGFSHHDESFVRKAQAASLDADALFLVPSLALFCERRWPAQFSRWLRSENCARRMRAGRASRPAVEHHQLVRVCSERNARADISGTPPPSGEDALRLSPGWRSTYSQPSHVLRQPPSLTKKSERGDKKRRAA